VHAADLSWSGFATAGYASDRSYTYERYVDRSGTFRRDSLAGAQLVAELAPRWSATVRPPWRRPSATTSAGTPDCNGLSVLPPE
jgi:hypothetical protein